MIANPALVTVANNILGRSLSTRAAYLEKLNRSKKVAFKNMSCSNKAHALASFDQEEKTHILGSLSPKNIGIITAYNDLLSAHAPYEHYPLMIKKKLSEFNLTTQVAAGVPAMCDGITQGLPGMELSLFSREAIAQSLGVGLTHAIFDGVVCLGICDKIVPGLLIGGLSFGHLPFLFLPSGPMPSSKDYSNKQKAEARKAFAENKISEEALLKIEMSCYGEKGTCTFYGTANTNQMMMEFLGLHLPGASFISPFSPLRDQLNQFALTRFAHLLGEEKFTLSSMINEKSLVNALAGLAATGGSTNHTLHIVAIAKMAGFTLTWDDFSDVSKVVPLLAQIYPNGSSDVNDFSEAGGCPFVIEQLLQAGLLFNDVFTLMGEGLDHYACFPFIEDGMLQWQKNKAPSLRATDCLRPFNQPFLKDAGVKLVTGNLGRGIAKVSAIDEKYWFVEAKAKVFYTQEDLHIAYKQGQLNEDFIAVLVFQGPKACGMPELHQLMPILASLQDHGFRVALVTDGRLSGASAKVPAVIHLYPEAFEGSVLAKIRNGDLITVDLRAGFVQLLVSDEELDKRIPVAPDLSHHETGFGRELFSIMRRCVSHAELGATIFD